ncbi:TPA: hypothetical protein QH942_002777 [Klebsiella aerogenes]|uniref:hypothetical protein n=1 Tax=Klebsiella aerogenes TaxID=548 RepID=UPI00277D639F|nr:hypothetical protein [Klebsiella aerogenes]
MKKYLYLTQPEWAGAWVNGGEIPLNLATAYKRMDRDGIYTPDEGLIDDTTHDIQLFDPAIIQFGGDFKNVSIGGITVGGEVVFSNFNGSRYADDGVILSLCNQKDASIKDRLRKSVCVEIISIDVLKRELDNQFGVVSEARNCEYTNTHNRGHFLKSEQDSWQDEFRLFWKKDGPLRAMLPSGIGKIVDC